MLGVLPVISEPPCKTPSPHDELPRRGVVTMRLLAGEGLTRDLLQESFPHADTGYCEVAQIQEPPERNESNRRDTHHVRAIAPHGIGLHSLAHIPFENVRKPLAQQR